MAQMNITFEVMKHNILKLGKVFDLDTIETDDYELVILTESNGLNKDNLDKVDDIILGKEASNYARPLVEMIFDEVNKGYEVSTGAVEVIVNDITTVGGLLLVKKSSQDILAFWFSNGDIVIGESFTISPQDKLWVYKMED